MDIILHIDYYRIYLNFTNVDVEQNEKTSHHHLVSHAESFCNSLLRIALEAGRVTVTVTDYVLNFIENILWSVASVCVHPSSLAPTNSEFRQFPGMEDV